MDSRNHLLLLHRLRGTFRSTNTSQILDLGANGANDLITPAYAIYEQGILSKVAMINFMDDNQTGTNDLQVTIQLPDGAPQTCKSSMLICSLCWLFD